MKTIGISAWLRSVPTAAALLACRKVARSEDLLGARLQMADGRTYVPFRNTIRVSPVAEPVVLQPRFHLRFMPSDHHWMYRIFRPVCIITTPFFVGLDGFRSKLWMEDTDSGDFAGLYQWDGEASARAYAEGLAKVLRIVSLRGSVRYELTTGTVENYLRQSRL